MNKILLLVLALGLSPVLNFAQSLEEDNMVLFMKANVLYESGRYDEAVRMYNQILKADRNHTNALFMRSKTKYELGAYKGTKMDILLYIELAGVTKDVIKLMASTESRLYNVKAAKNYAETALELDPFDDDMHLLMGDILIDSGSKNDGCESYAISADLGNNKAKQRMAKSCNGYRPSKRPTETSGTSGQESQDIPTTTQVEEKAPQRGEDGVITLEEIVKEAENNPETQYEDQRDEAPYIDTRSRQTIEIDSKLDVIIADGLGSRRLTSKPSIFMLSDQDGIVMIDMCVDDNGRVSEATFNRDESTIFRSSLTSLALRKAKEFIFERDNIGEQCGTMAFNIKS